MLCTHKTASSASLVIQKFVPTLLTHISPNSRPFLVGIVSSHHETQFCFEPQNCFPNSKFLLKYVTITEPPMGHTQQESLLESKEKHLISLELIQHVFKTVMGLFDDKQVDHLIH